MTTPTLSMGYVRALFEASGARAADVQAALEEAGVSAGLVQHLSARVTEAQFAALYRALVRRLDDEMLRFFSRPLRPGALKFTCLSLLDARNLQVALHRWSLFLRMLQDDFQLAVSVQDGWCRIAMQRNAGAPTPAPIAEELMLKLVHGVSSWLVGHKLPLERVDFAFEAPAFAEDYQHLYPGPVRFGQPLSALYLDASWLERPLRRSAQELPEFLRRAPEGWMFAEFRHGRLAQRVRSHLSAHLLQEGSAQATAHALNLSVRTLHRRLAEEGTSFQRIKDELRRDLAVYKLTRTRQSIAAIGAELGFDNAASFHRAFRLWTGQTPGAYRGRGVSAQE
ncbi:AraC family transcriptional regulator [Caldimonas taiwanensis]|uniref:AraC family transcriptional regulator n=1 Tax=Caldimonas taiwanensis TaxID=307483 RepID=UPI000AA4CF7E|nr:AraC family transcriptional regulator [Caldimonas taiwanensis]